jgi:putative SOS response-associated peptidase YedK
MCGRYGFGNPARLGTLPLGVPLPDLDARYNVAPSQAVPCLLQEGDGRRVDLLRWGLVPFWASDPAIGNRLANARADSVAVKPSFRNAFKSRRGLMLADLFYEWQVVPGQKVKQPWCIRLEDDAPFAMAALWERWSPTPAQDAPPEPASPLLTCCVITTDANRAMAPIHDRMPVIVPPADFDRWLDPNTPPAEALALLRPFAGTLRPFRVTTYVNAPRNGGAACLAPLQDG